MSKLAVVIVEDEEKSLEFLRYMIERHVLDEVFIQAAFTDSVAAREYLQTHPVDLVFLDIQMPGLNGFELLDSLEAVNFDVIFTTAFNNYATKAFRYFALDYLIKPVIPEELKEAVSRVGQREHYRYDKQDLASIFETMLHRKENEQLLAVPTKSGVEFIRFDDVLRLEADRNYTFIHMIGGKKIYTSKTLKYFESLLPPAKFYRPHQSHIINISGMRKYVKSDGGYIVMSDGAHVSLARGKRQEFSERFH